MFLSSTSQYIDLPKKVQTKHSGAIFQALSSCLNIYKYVSTLFESMKILVSGRKHSMYIKSLNFNICTAQNIPEKVHSCYHFTSVCPHISAAYLGEP